MKNVLEHIEHIKGKPHHIRKQVAFGTAGVFTALIAFIWLVSSIGTGAFALKDTSFAQINGEENVLTVSGDDTGQLAGVAATLPSSRQESISQDSARIQIVDAVSTSSGKKMEQTTIPF
jgi:hypothetical protein